MERYSRLCRIFLVMLAVASLCGCSAMMRGNLYSDTVLPYSTDFNNTPIGSKKCVITSHRLRDPTTGAGLSAEWDTRTIREAAHKAGISTIHYADMATLTLFMNTYRRRALIIYGD